MIIHKDLIGENKLDADTTVFLITVFLHINNIINREKMIAIFKGLREKTFIRKIKTYHSNINDKWYEDTDTFDIMLSVFNNYKNSLKYDAIIVEEFLKYINLYLNKKRNYCINFIYCEIVYVLIELFECEEKYHDRHFGDTSKSLLKLLEQFKIDFPKVDTYRTYNYNSYDPYETHNEWVLNKISSYEKRLERNVINMKKAFGEYLDSLKDEAYQKNPNKFNYLNVETAKNSLWFYKPHLILK